VQKEGIALDKQQASNRIFTYAAFTLNGFDDQKRNQTFVKQISVLKLKFHACNFKQDFYLLFKQSLITQKYFYISFSFGTWLTNLHVKHSVGFMCSYARLVPILTSLVATRRLQNHRHFQGIYFNFQHCKPSFLPSP